MTKPTQTGVALRSLSAITDRILLDCTTTLPNLTPDHAIDVSGLKLTGTNAAKRVGQLSRLRPDLPVMFDAAHYEEYDATPRDPFHLPKDQLFPITIEDRIRDQLTLGASGAYTPTGHLSPTTEALESAIHQANRLDADNVVVDLPLHHEWLSAESSFERVRKAILESRHPVSVSLAHERDPLDAPGIAHRSRQLAQMDATVYMNRVDFLGFDFMAHGGAGASIGLSSKLRHGSSLDVKGKRFRSTDNRASVIWPDFLRFVRPLYLDEVYETNAAPGCPCPYCDGRALTSFSTTKRSQQRARDHNAWWIQALTAQILVPSDSDRLSTWRECVAMALESHRRLAVDHQKPNFAAPKSFDVWAW